MVLSDLTIFTVSRCIYLYLLTKVTSSALPIISCDFDKGRCNDLIIDHGEESKFDWKIINGSTNAPGTDYRNTGPTHDHTRKDGTGKYIFINSSWPKGHHPPINHMNGDMAILKSVYKHVNHRKSLCLRFSYHMKGLTTGTLSVFLQEEGKDNCVLVFELSGEQGQDWKDARVWTRGKREHRVRRKRIRVIFRAKLSYGYTSDIALDDIELVQSDADHCHPWPPESDPKQHERKTIPSPTPIDGPEDRDTCGKRKAEKIHLKGQLSLIVRGTITIPGQWPWMAMLSRPSTSSNLVPSCGGTLLGTSWIVTAAHCVFNMESKKDKVVHLGVNNVHRAKERNIQTRDISAVYIHPEYNSMTSFNNDIAILKLTTPAVLHDEYIESICLPDDNVEIQDGESLKIAGYGKEEKGRFPDVLQEGDVILQNFSKCYREYGVHFTSNMICAGNHGTDTCTGDSGGPLMYKDKNGQWILAGITSWGYAECGVLDGVYTKVTAQRILEWIKAVTHNQKEEDQLKFRDTQNMSAGRSINQVITR